MITILIFILISQFIFFFPKIASPQFSRYYSYDHNLNVEKKKEIRIYNNYIPNQKSKNFQSESAINKFQISTGAGMSFYDKISSLYTIEIFSYLTKSFSAGMGTDFYNILINFSSPRKIRSFSIYGLYYNALFHKNPSLAEYKIGGGLSFSDGTYPVGIFKLDFYINKNLSVGGEYKQPFFGGADFGAPPLMLFDLVLSYKIKL